MGNGIQPQHVVSHTAIALIWHLAASRACTFAQLLSRTVIFCRYDQPLTGSSEIFRLLGSKVIVHLFFLHQPPDLCNGIQSWYVLSHAAITSIWHLAAFWACVVAHVLTRTVNSCRYGRPLTGSSEVFRLLGLMVLAHCLKSTSRSLQWHAAMVCNSPCSRCVD